jgi:hypothetical protein
MSSLLHRIAVLSARRRALVIGVWLVVLAGLVVGSRVAGTKYSRSAQVAGSDSAAANDCRSPARCTTAPCTQPSSTATVRASHERCWA